MKEVADSIIVIAASAGGVAALMELAAQLPRDCPAAICVVLHVGASPSMLPELLNARGPNPAEHAQNGQRLLPGTIYVAPPDHHMLVDRDTITLTRGPKENHVRPAADPLFRSAAVTWGNRAIGVILTGGLDDGTAGLRAIKECGGAAVVQDPATAVSPSMPQSALDNVAVDFCLPLENIGAVLMRLVRQPFGPASTNNNSLKIEVAINRGDATLENLAKIAEPFTLTCPDCGGSLWEINEGKALRYRCHTGHAYGVRSLSLAQVEATELMLRSSVRALREREILLRRLASVSQTTGDAAQAAAGVAHADRLSAEVEALMAFSEGVNLPVTDETRSA